jgi:acetoin utilization deacetylase AcuC-like enzyme
MPLGLPVVWSETNRRHEPDAEIWIGLRMPAVEVAARVDAILETLAAEGAEVVEAQEHGDEHVLAVHDAELVDFLARAWNDWQAAGLPSQPGQNRVVPYVFAHPGVTDDPAIPTAVWARPGYFAFDTMTLIGPGTWEAARSAVDTALTAADLVLAGAPAAYACCRPPGHHVTRRAYGGSCYLNSTAATAARLRGELGRVAVIDVDAHHGNGTQSIFWDDPDVRTGSVHVDPGAGWFPHFLGFASETGGGGNRNLPLAPATGDDGWVAAVEELVAWAREGEPAAVVVALGVDAAASDPESPLGVTGAGFRAAGRAIGSLGLPVVLVQEGGYDLAAIGPHVREALAGVEEGLAGA